MAISEIFMKDQKGVLAGSVKVPGYEHWERVTTKTPTTIFNKIEPSRAAQRTAASPAVAPLTVTTMPGPSTVQAFRAVAAGTCLGTLQLVQVQSDHENAVPKYTSTMGDTFVYFVGFSYKRSREGTNGTGCVATISFKGPSTTVEWTQVNQEQQPIGKVAASFDVQQDQAK